VEALRGCSQDRTASRPGGFGPGLLLALHMGAAPDAFDPHQRHRPIPGRQIPHPRRVPTMQLGLRPAHRAPTGRCRVVWIAYSISPSRSDTASTAMPASPSITVALLLSITWGLSSVSVTPRIMRPQARFRTQPANRVDPPLPRFIEKSRISAIKAPELLKGLAEAEAAENCLLAAAARLRCRRTPTVRTEREWARKHQPRSPA
jgi:hypothetical protein